MMTKWSQDNYIKACRFAAVAHRGQVVPGTDLPYLVHLSLVTMEVLAALQTTSHEDGDVTLQCAWLHDSIEDTPTTYQDLKEEFGQAVADGVLALTKNATVPEAFQIDDSLQRIQRQPKGIWMVKLADRITNLQPPPPHWSLEKARAYHAGALKIHAVLKDADETLGTRLATKAAAYWSILEHRRY